MRPTTRELVESVANALEHQVAPAVQDKWAASVLRSAIQLLGHVAVRAQDEARILIEHAADARGVLEIIAPRLHAERRDVGALRDSVQRALQAPAAAPYDVASLAAQDDDLQAVIESLLRHREALDATVQPGQTRVELREYLHRRLGREQHLYFPAFTGPPF